MQEKCTYQQVLLQKACGDLEVERYLVFKSSFTKFDPIGVIAVLISIHLVIN